jgi:two-component sensor histidine kinase
VTAQKLAETKLKVSLAEKEVLLREIHHRVKNNLQMISSLLSLKVRSIQDPQMLAPLIESQHRIHTMALIHEKLYSATNLAQIDFAEYVHSLAADLFRSAMVASNVSLQTEVARIELPVDTVISCGLIINELVANAIKHAFPTGQPGGVLIRFTADPNDRYTLTVQDNGIGLPADLELDRSPSLGLRLVCALTNKLRGTIELERHHGTCFRITFSSSRCEKIT